MNGAKRDYHMIINTALVADCEIIWGESIKFRWFCSRRLIVFGQVSIYKDTGYWCNLLNWNLPVPSIFDFIIQFSNIGI